MAEARTWDALARRYDLVVRAFDRSYPAIRALLADDLRGRARVLEVAAGTGQFTLDLARVAEQVVATDIAPQMIARLRARVAETRAASVRVEVMSAYDLDAPDAAFDAAFCAGALHVMQAPQRALAELRRVLAPGGLLIAPTFLHGVDRPRRALSRALGLVSPFVAHTRFNLTSLRALISDAGFNVARAQTLPGLFPVGYIVANRGGVAA